MPLKKKLLKNVFQAGNGDKRHFFSKYYVLLAQQLGSSL